MQTAVYPKHCIEQLVIHRLIALCHELGMVCVAEGIETDSQIELLKKLDCDRFSAKDHKGF